MKEVSDDAVKTIMNPSFGVSSNEYRKDRMSFAGSGRPAPFTVDYIDQGVDGANAWRTFVLDTAEGFTQPGVESINDSTRTCLGHLRRTSADPLEHSRCGQRFRRPETVFDKF